MTLGTKPRNSNDLVVDPGDKVCLREDWLIRSSAQVKDDGEIISSVKFLPKDWYPVSLPSTVLSALTKNGIYPDMRIGLNSFLIPDASDEFNERYDLSKYSYLSEKRNPWKDPYWYRTEFKLIGTALMNIGGEATNKRYWLNFKGINYRADVWLNGIKVVDSKDMVGAFQRYKLDITNCVKTGEDNCLAVRIHQVDHPGTPDTQLEVFGRDRGFHKEIMKDVTLVMSIGYDCMPTVPDRNMGIWQDVYIECTGPVDIRNPFVKTSLPLPKTSPASLTISAELVNASSSRQEGILKGTIEDDVEFEQRVTLLPGETKEVIFSPSNFPQLMIDNPRLWWPKNYGEQSLYSLSLKFEIDGEISDREDVTFGIRQISKELYELDGAHGLRLYVNGERIFCRGGYIQPEVMFDWDIERMETEIRYLTSANLNLVYFEDVPNPPDEFLDLCDRYGLMFGNCFYGCYWMTPGTEHPLDIDLLERGTVDIIKRYRNHPSLVLYMAMNEGDTREDVYERWRKNIIELDGTRIFIPSGSFPDYRKDVPEWIRKDIPVGMNDYPPKSYGWQEPSTYYRWVREERNWMFMMESGSASLPPIDSLRRFIPDLGRTVENAPYPLNETWAHHGANHYYKDYDSALRRIYGEPDSLADYCLKGHLVTADQHRAMFEAVNHRMWNITSGFTEWKINACWPDIQWQIYDWYLRPMVSYYYIKSACEPLHIQLSPLDSCVTVINNYLKPMKDLSAIAEVYDFDAKLLWEHRADLDVPANSYKDVFVIPPLSKLTSIYFVKIELRDSEGKLVSNNFYWLSSEHHDDSGSFIGLSRLPLVKLDVSYKIENKGQGGFACVKVKNPTDKIAFFIHLALTKGIYGEEILPIFWDDNYFSLLPGEQKEVNAIFALRDLDGATPTLEVGGWNIQTSFECSHLKASKTEVEPNEPFTVTATIENTFIDGSRIGLYVDEKMVDSKLFWARAGKGGDINFTLKLNQPGPHEIRVGTATTSVLVR